MTLIDLQRRIAEVGRIRIGQQVPVGSGGKTRPAKLDTFRLTSSDKLRIEQAAQLYGGDPKPWQAPAGKHWEVVTTSTALDVIVPPTDMAFSQAYELWSAGGCQRRCDGRSESLSEGPCLCDPDVRECNIHTRLSVMLRDLPGLGVWRIDTSGFYAAVELSGAVEVIRMAAGRGQMLPARLRLDQRQVKRPDAEGKVQTRKFAVPVLDIEVSPGQLLSGGPVVAGQIEAVDEQTGELRLLTPVPAALPSGPVGTVAEQTAAVDTPAPRKARKNAAAPLPATGLAPRTAQQAADDDGVVDAEEVPSEQEAPDLITAAQLTKLHVCLANLGVKDRDIGLRMVAGYAGRTVESTKHLSKAEASRCIDGVEAAIETRDAS